MMLTLVTITAQVEAPLPQVPYLKVTDHSIRGFGHHWYNCK